VLTRRVKIVCTIGPATQEPARLRELIEAGMNVARLNFSHGAREDHAAVIARVRALSAELRQPVAILQDLQGPKIRLGRLRGGKATLTVGQPFVLTTDQIEGDGSRASISWAGLPADVKPGDPILLSDGLLRVEVLAVRGGEVECRVVDGGEVRERAGINLPGAVLGLPSLTEKDRADLAFGVEQGVDFMALSFVRRAADVTELKGLLAAAGARIPVIAKLEKPQAIEALDEILEVADGVMVARGDLGVEISPEQVPFIQKTIIHRAAQASVPVITATQMLESMIGQPRPTRAEASDVANAVFDGTDAVMLSGETSIGRYPVDAVRMMDRIVREAETHLTFLPERRRRGAAGRAVTFPDAVADAAGRAAADLQATAIVAFTRSGFTARLISRHRPAAPIVAFTPHEAVCRQLALYWGVVPRLVSLMEDADQLIAAVDAELRREGLVAAGDNLVFLFGRPTHREGTANVLRLHRAGDPLS
jgi:pyruvate kinase